MRALIVLSALAFIATAPTPRPVTTTSNAHDVDLADLVPASGRLDHVWYVPAGHGVPEIAVAWSFRARRATPDWSDRTRYVLTLWRREAVDGGSARWVPHTLVRASPFPFDGRSVRLADVTGDGHDDLLVTVQCIGCNHGTAIVDVYGDVDGSVRRVYGTDTFFGVSKEPAKGDAGVRGRVISETAWGAAHGLLWFDKPGPERAVCCPEYRVVSFVRLTSHGWMTVERRRVTGVDPYLAKGWPPT